MKKLLTLLLITSAFISTAQIKVSEKNVNLDGGKNGFYIEIPYADKKETEKELKDLFKDWKGNYSSKKDVAFADDCELKDMGENTFDAYGMVEENGEDGVFVSVAINLGGAYLNSGEHGARYKVMQSLLHEWAVEIAKAAVGEEVEAAEDILKDNEKELKDMEKDQEKLEDEIEDYKKKIEENKKAIEESKKNQAEQKEKIKKQQGAVEEAKKKQKSIK